MEQMWIEDSPDFILNCLMKDNICNGGLLSDEYNLNFYLKNVSFKMYRISKYD